LNHDIHLSECGIRSFFESKCAILSDGNRDQSDIEDQVDGTNRYSPVGKKTYSNIRGEGKALNWFETILATVLDLIC